MIIRVNTRSNGEQLGDYVSALNENEAVEILEVDGREDATEEYLKQVVLSMELNCELTKAKYAFLNIQINPAYGDDKAMTREDWCRSADILEEEFGYKNQRRVIVLHTKKDRTHAHVVWERYNHETGKVIDTKNSRLKAKFARVRIEKELGHKRTKWRNEKSPEIKETITKLWNSTKTGAEFISMAKKAGYVIAAGSGNRPFMIVDENGVSCDLVRQLKDVRTKEVRARLRNETLIKDKDAIELIRKKTDSSKKGDKAKDGDTKFVAKMADEFKASTNQITKPDPQYLKLERQKAIAIAFKDSQNDIVRTANTRSDKVKAEIAFLAFRDYTKGLTRTEESNRKLQAMEDYLKAKDEYLKAQLENLKRVREKLEKWEQEKEEQTQKKKSYEP